MLNFTQEKDNHKCNQTKSRCQENIFHLSDRQKLKGPDDTQFGGKV